jgi:hypothetical protein
VRLLFLKVWGFAHTQTEEQRDQPADNLHKHYPKGDSYSRLADDRTAPARAAPFRPPNGNQLRES